MNRAIRNLFFFSLMFFKAQGQIADCGELIEKEGLFFTLGAKEPFTGICGVAFQNGKVKATREYSEGMKAGVWKQWHPNGALAEEKSYENGVKNGTVTKWNEEGKKVFEARYQAGSLHGTLMQYYPSGQTKILATYERGKLNGKYLEWFENGRLEKEKNYLNGEKHGASTEWFENGQKKESKHFVNGEKDGEFTSWFENGQVENQKFYKRNDEVGQVKQWDDDGTLTVSKTISDSQNSGDVDWVYEILGDIELNPVADQVRQIASVLQENNREALRKFFNDSVLATLPDKDLKWISELFLGAPETEPQAGFGIGVLTESPVKGQGTSATNRTVEMGFFFNQEQLRKMFVYDLVSINYEVNATDSSMKHLDNYTLVGLTIKRKEDLIKMLPQY